MSQEKVDRHKEEKKNRTQIIKKEKRRWRLMQVGGVAVVVLLVAWVGVSIYTFSGSDETETVELPTYTIDTTALDDYTMEVQYD